MQWVLVLITMVGYTPEASRTGVYDSMNRCFEQREHVVNRTNPKGRQAICIRVEMEQNNVGK